MAYSSNWNETAPPGTEARSLGDDRIKELKTQLRERLATEHSSINGSGGATYLMHEWVVVSKSANYEATLNDHVILVTTSTSEITITLPNATTCEGKPYKIKKVDSGNGKIILDGYSTQTIDGDQTLDITPQYGFVDIISNGTNWVIISTNCNFDWDKVWSDAVHDHSSDAEGGISVNLKFLATPTNKVSWTDVADWTDVDISSDTGGDTAKAALLAVELDFVATNGGGSCVLTGLFRKNGSSHTSSLPRISGRALWTSGVYSHENYCSGMFIVECDGSEIFEVKLQADAGTPSSTTFKVDLIGYLI